jgi:D-psicose/D-tagatose/L-ribulose 3-epimerase
LDGHPARHWRDGYGGTISLEPFRRRDERIGIPFAQWKAPTADESVELEAACAFIKNLIVLNGGRR